MAVPTVVTIAARFGTKFIPITPLRYLADGVVIASSAAGGYYIARIVAGGHSNVPEAELISGRCTTMEEAAAKAARLDIEAANVLAVIGKLQQAQVLAQAGAALTGGNGAPPPPNTFGAPPSVTPEQLAEAQRVAAEKEELAAKLANQRAGNEGINPL